MKDVLMVSYADGADAVIEAEDMVLTSGMETAIYLALFGGGDYWANGLLAADGKYSSKTEQVFKSVALNTSGRLAIEQAIKDDLQLLASEEGLELSVMVKIAIDRADIQIQLGNVVYEYTYYASGNVVYVQKL